MLDLLVGYDHKTIDISSHDLTSFQFFLGMLWNTSLPMGVTNFVAIFHSNITFILKPEILNVAKLFVDDIVTQKTVPMFGYFKKKSLKQIRKNA